jgi:hypothetical protein
LLMTGDFRLISVLTNWEQIEKCLHSSQVTVINKCLWCWWCRRKKWHLRRICLIFHCLVERRRCFYHLGLAMRHTFQFSLIYIYFVDFIEYLLIIWLMLPLLTFQYLFMACVNDLQFSVYIWVDTIGKEKYQEHSIEWWMLLRKEKGKLEIYILVCFRNFILVLY